MFQVLWDFVKIGVPLVIKLLFFYTLFGFVASLFSFVIYHTYYGFVYIGGFFLTYLTFQIVYLGFVGLLFYGIYLFIRNNF